MQSAKFKATFTHLVSVLPGGVFFFFTLMSLGSRFAKLTATFNSCYRCCFHSELLAVTQTDVETRVFSLPHFWKKIM